MDQVIQSRFPADVPAFPMPEAGFSIDFEAVVGLQLILIFDASGNQLAWPVLSQKFHGAHLLGGGNLLFGNIGHQITAIRNSFTRSSRSQGKSGLPKCP